MGCDINSWLFDLWLTEQLYDTQFITVFFFSNKYGKISYIYCRHFFLSIEGMNLKEEKKKHNLYQFIHELHVDTFMGLYYVFDLIWKMVKLKEIDHSCMHGSGGSCLYYRRDDNAYTRMVDYGCNMRNKDYHHKK